MAQSAPAAPAAAATGAGPIPASSPTAPVVPIPPGMNPATLAALQAEFTTLKDAMTSLLGRMHNAFHDAARDARK